ncbi:hypothetical protein C9426_01060 [Serratia sp. S1B]|nr:hypothetical protein C9426_01060 [Serratia sp. S1B]
MLIFKDLNFVEHVVHLRNINNVVLHTLNNEHRMTFHFIGPHVLPVQVDLNTFNRIKSALEKYDV